MENKQKLTLRNLNKIITPTQFKESIIQTQSKTPQTPTLPQMQPQSSVQNSKSWRIWHSTNYSIGAVFFLFGSLLLFPYMSIVWSKSAEVSAWLYTIGSLCFCFADYTQWSHYQPVAVCRTSKGCCRFPSFSVNFLLSFTGSTIYFIGSALFIPQINKMEMGLYLFIIGSAAIFVSQSWKLIRVILEGCHKNAIMKALQQDLTGVLVDLFAGLGGAMYFIGSFIFFNTQAVMQIIAAAIFSTGGFFFYLSAAFMIKRYFINKKVNDGSISVETSETRVQVQDKDIVSQTTN